MRNINIFKKNLTFDFWSNVHNYPGIYFTLKTLIFIFNSLKQLLLHKKNPSIRKALPSPKRPDKQPFRPPDCENSKSHHSIGPRTTIAMKKGTHRKSDYTKKHKKQHPRTATRRHTYTIMRVTVMAFAPGAGVEKLGCVLLLADIAGKMSGPYLRVTRHH